jgi:hypothetical protein
MFRISGGSLRRGESVCDMVMRRYVGFEEKNYKFKDVAAFGIKGLE